jgi:hypothetical protein
MSSPGALGAVFAAVVVGCSATPAAQPPGSPPTLGGEVGAAPPPDASVAITEEPAPPAPPPPAPRIELTFMGDIMFGGLFKSGKFSPVDVPNHDPLAAVAPLFASDLPLGNLETTVMAQIPHLEGQLRFVATPDQVAVLPKNGLTAVTLANNHAADVDAAGITETAQHLADLGLTVIGGARADEPVFRAETVEVRGWRIAYVAATARLNRRQRKGDPQVPFALDRKLPPRLIPVIEAARPDHDLVIVVVHWGTQYADAPSRWQIDAAHAFIDAGADAVIGHHPHVIQGIERYGRGVIAYSLGNFSFQNGTEPERYTGVLRLGFARDDRCLDQLVFHPAEVQRKPVYHPVPATGSALKKTARRLVTLSAARPLSTRWEQDGELLVGPAACAP